MILRGAIQGETGTATLLALDRLEERIRVLETSSNALASVNDALVIYRQEATPADPEPGQLIALWIYEKGGLPERASVGLRKSSGAWQWTQFAKAAS